MIDTKVLEKLSNIHVLIVEDDETTLYALEQSLELYCKKVSTACNGMEGFEIFEKEKPDVVITDINMPELTGHEMIEAMHRISPHFPIIIMTSYDSTENILKSIDAKVYNYLKKPIKIEELQLSLLMATKDIYNQIINITDEYKYNCETKELFFKDSLISFTKTQQDLIYLLIRNINKTISYETIENFVWGEKTMSREALRMCIKKIRKKTYPKFIENAQQQGYKISTK